MGSAITRQYNRARVLRGEMYVPDKFSKDLVKYVRDQVEGGEEVLRRDKRLCLERIAFYMGRQWSEWDDRKGRLVDRQVSEEEDRLVYNYVRQIVDDTVARLTENRPTVTVVPSTTEDEDKQKARACEKLVEHLWRTMKMQKKIRQYVKLAVISGFSILKIWWDPTQGRDHVESFVDPETGEQAEQTIRTGKLKAEELSLLEFGCDLAKSWENVEWAYHLGDLHLDVVHRRWEAGKHVKQTATWDEDRYAGKLLRSFRAGRATSDVLTERVRVIEYFEKPSPRYPNGLFAVVAGNVLLDYRLELPNGELPFVVMRHKDVPGKLIGDGALEDLFDPQRVMNEKEGQRKVNSDRCANRGWLAPEGSFVKKPRGIPGEIATYDHNVPPPTQMVVPGLAPDHAQLSHEALEHMYAISGQSQLTRGDIPSAISGRAIGMATDLEATRLGPTIKELAESIEEFAGRALRYWRLHAKVSETLIVLGRNKKSEAVVFHRDDMPDETDVVVWDDSMLPRHPSYRKEQILMVAGQGWLGTPDDMAAARKVRRMLEFGEEFEGDESPDRDYAREEHTAFEQGVAAWIEALSGPLQGQPTQMPDGSPGPASFLAFMASYPNAPVVRPDENHEVMDEEHETYSKQAAFRRLPGDCQQWLMGHRSQHFFENWKQTVLGKPWWLAYLPPQMRAEFEQAMMAQQGQPMPPEQPPPGPGPQRPPIDAFGPDPPLAPPPPIGTDGANAGLVQRLAAMMSQGVGQGMAQPQIPEVHAGPRGPGVRADGLEGLQ